MAKSRRSARSTSAPCARAWRADAPRWRKLCAPTPWTPTDMDTIMHHDDTPDLDLQLAQLRTGMAGIDTPRCVEKELMQAFAAQFAQRRPWYRRLGLLEWSAAGIG